MRRRVCKPLVVQALVSHACPLVLFGEQRFTLECVAEASPGDLPFQAVSGGVM
jgi:hypothetical protein